MKQQFQEEIERLYDYIRKPYKDIDEDIRKGKLKLVENSNCDNLYIVFKNSAIVGVINVSTKHITTKYR